MAPRRLQSPIHRRNGIDRIVVALTRKNALLFLIAVVVLTVIPHFFSSLRPSGSSAVSVLLDGSIESLSTSSSTASTGATSSTARKLGRNDLQEKLNYPRGAAAAGSPAGSSTASGSTTLVDPAGSHANVSAAVKPPDGPPWYSRYTMRWHHCPCAPAAMPHALLLQALHRSQKTSSAHHSCDDFNLWAYNYFLLALVHPDPACIVYLARACSAFLISPHHLSLLGIPGKASSHTIISRSGHLPACPA